MREYHKKWRIYYKKRVSGRGRRTLPLATAWLTGAWGNALIPHTTPPPAMTSTKTGRENSAHRVATGPPSQPPYRRRAPEGPRGIRWIWRGARE